MRSTDAGARARMGSSRFDGNARDHVSGALGRSRVSNAQVQVLCRGCILLALPLETLYQICSRHAPVVAFVIAFALARSTHWGEPSSQAPPSGAFFKSWPEPKARALPLSLRPNELLPTTHRAS
eukprot:scaffold75458_cov31-Tisochrysis_lutea.AAC.2